tara:strand:+ start:1218 stop:2039 length:822 start_codon:yes stop_codon:yes gene_type:complete
MKLPSYLDYDKDTIKRLRTQKIFRYGDVERFDKELDYLMSFKDELIKDFFAEYDSIEDCLNKGTTSAMGAIYKNLNKSKEGVGKAEDLKGVSKNGEWDLDAWRVLVVKYHNPNIAGPGSDPNYQNELLDRKRRMDGYNVDKFKTMKGIGERYGDICPILEYSILPANSIIERHIGIENKEGKHIRIHIPLIVPKGDIFFEANGEEVDWSQPWGFNNQYMHSAHNNTDEHRLIMLIDLERQYCGIPPAPKFRNMNMADIGDPHFKYRRENASKI